MCKQKTVIVGELGPGQPACEACFSATSLRYECDRCHCVQQISHPMHRYQIEGSQSWSTSTWACRGACQDFTHWRLVSDGAEMRIIVIGEVGTGKSTLLANVFGVAAKAGNKAGGETKVVKEYPGYNKVIGHATVIDTPGIGDKHVKLGDLTDKINEKLAGKPIDCIIMTFSIKNPRLSLGHQVGALLFPLLVKKSGHQDQDEKNATWGRCIITLTACDLVKKDPDEFGPQLAAFSERKKHSIPVELADSVQSDAFKLATVGKGDYGYADLEQKMKGFKDKPPVHINEIARDDLVKIVAKVNGISPEVVDRKK